MKVDEKQKAEIEYAITNREKDREKEMTEECEVKRTDRISSKKNSSLSLSCITKM